MTMNEKEIAKKGAEVQEKPEPILNRAHSRPFLFLLGAAHSANHSLFLVLPQVLVLITEELAISKFTIGTIAMVASLLYGAGSLIGGALSDRVGERKILIFSLAFSGLSTVVFLFATELFVFGSGMLLIGMLAGLYHPAANALISKSFRTKMGESMGIHGVGGSLGVMLTPLIAALLGASFGWRAAFFFFGVLCVGLSMILSSRAYPSLEPDQQPVEREGRVLKLSSLWFLLVLNITIGLYMKGVELFFQTYTISYTFNDVNIELSAFIAATAASSLLAAGVAGQLLGGRATDAFGSKKVLILTSGGVVVSLLLLQLLSIPILSVGIFAVLYGLSFYAHQPAFNSLMGRLTPMRRRGIVYGIFFFSSFGIGAFSQSVTGYLADTFGLQSAFSVLTCFSIAAFLLSFLIPPYEKREESTPDS